jgi:hypothetical protein
MSQLNSSFNAKALREPWHFCPNLCLLIRPNASTPWRDSAFW